MESSAEQQRPARASRSWGDLRHAPVALVFAAACVAVQLYVESLGGSTNTWVLVRYGALERGAVWRGEPWRLITSAFLHIGWLHLACNVYFGLQWEAPVERALGSRRFALIYLGAAVVASAAHLLVSDRVAAGASGAGFGVIAATLVLRRRAVPGWSAFARDPLVRSTALSIVIWSALLAGVAAHGAHAGGFAGGAALAWALTTPASATRRERLVAWGTVFALLVVPTAIAAAPRASLTPYGRYRLERDVADALRAHDLPAAHRALERARQAGYTSGTLEFNRGVLIETEGDLDRAIAIYEGLAKSEDRAVGRRALAASKRTKARKLWRGTLADHAEALTLLAQACDLGDDYACDALKKIPAN
ncbi:MAG TPA: rhomboid family intramembrane serine protease, partial [Anaeromyxobacteraceae bacterium]|nr:rhomboid family intramembrane serine protease [Anaeromyxobacteraceae bacterium]